MTLQNLSIFEERSWTGREVGGQLAANFFIHNSFYWLMLNLNSRVGGQLAATSNRTKTNCRVISGACRAFDTMKAEIRKRPCRQARS
jgi:hypothetical protein